MRLLFAVCILWIVFAAAFVWYSGSDNSWHPNWFYRLEASKADPLGLDPAAVWYRIASFLCVPVVVLAVFAGGCRWVAQGFRVTLELHYLERHRLADVLALLQVLSLKDTCYRSEEGLLADLQGPPRSASSWVQLASEHQEFFRVRPDADRAVSLLSRHVSKQSDSSSWMVPGFMAGLFELALEIHGRQLSRARAWHALVPLAVVAATSLAALVGTAIARLVN